MTDSSDYMKHAEAAGMSGDLTGRWSANVRVDGGEKRFTLQLNADGSAELTVRELHTGAERTFTGAFSYVETNAYGEAYHYRLCARGGNGAYEGVAALHTDFIHIETTAFYTLFFRNQSGTGLFSTVMGETTALMQPR